jgi:hypothetical protein
MTRRFIVIGIPLIMAWIVATMLSVPASTAQLTGSFTDWIDHPAIAYRTQAARDPVASLMARMDAGTVKLEDEGPSGYLRSVLAALGVSIESQMAVFVKDSVQARRINDNNPRTLFFNDSVVVGWVRGGFIELAAQDPQQGVVFYSLDRPLPIIGRPRFVRRDDCLTCHYSYDTVGVPGMLVRSAGQSAVDHRLPFDQRWGGWYVTGQQGAMRHLGNAAVATLFNIPPPAHTFDWPSFEGRFDATGYLSVHSDIAALMVFDHQMHAMNLLTRLGWEARVAASQHLTSRDGSGTADAKADAPIPLREGAREVVDYLLFVDEAPLTSPARGSTRFAETFAAQGPRDHNGRSLRQLDLTRRLLRYPCSYVIYTEQFDRLPAEAKNAVFQRLWQVLSGQERDRRYRRLTLADRTAIVEILHDTKPDLPSYFQAVVR